MKRLIKKAIDVGQSVTLEESDIDEIGSMLYWWVDGSFHFKQSEQDMFKADDIFGKTIDKAKQLYPETIYNGPIYRFIVINGNQIGNFIQGLQYNDSDDSFIRDKSVFNENLSNEDKDSIKQNLIKGYGAYQAFSKNEKFEWGYGGGSHLAIKIILNNGDGLDLNEIARVIDRMDRVVESDNEVVAKLREDIDIELLRVVGLVN